MIKTVHRKTTTNEKFLILKIQNMDYCFIVPRLDEMHCAIIGINESDGIYYQVSLDDKILHCTSYFYSKRDILKQTARQLVERLFPDDLSPYDKSQINEKIIGFWRLFHDWDEIYNEIRKLEEIKEILRC